MSKPSGIVFLDHVSANVYSRLGLFAGNCEFCFCGSFEGTVHHDMQENGSDFEDYSTGSESVFAELSTASNSFEMQRDGTSNQHAGQSSRGLSDLHSMRLYCQSERRCDFISRFSMFDRDLNQTDFYSAYSSSMEQ